MHGFVVQPHVHWQHVLAPEERKQPRLQQRCLAEPGEAEQRGQWRIQHEPPKLRGFLVAPVEELLRPLVEGAESRPRVLSGDLDLRGNAHPARPRRRSRSVFVSSARSPSLGCPLGACANCTALNASGTSAYRDASPA